VTLDAVDVALLRQLLLRPRAGMREYARELGLARATVHARLERLSAAGIITSWAPALSPAEMGFPVLALVHVHLRQGALDLATARLRSIPQILEAHATTGDADVFCRVVARDHRDLEAVIQRIIAVEGVVRTRTEIALSDRVPSRVLPILDLVAAQAPHSSRSRMRQPVGDATHAVTAAPSSGVAVSALPASRKRR
jgi:DNA-binding Lrp family transcriptional regulator